MIGIDFDVYNKKIELAEHILSSMGKVSDLMYKEIKNCIDSNQNLEVNKNLIEQIDCFVRLYSLVSQDKFIIDSNIIDIKEDLLNYFEQVENDANEYDELFEIEIFHDLSRLKHYYDYEIVFALFFKWCVTNDDNTLYTLVDFFLYYFDGSEIYPVDIDIYSSSYISYSSDFVNKLNELVYRIKDYLDDYEEYIKLVDDEVIFDSPYKNVIAYDDFLAFRVGLYWGEYWNKGCGAKSYLDFHSHPEKYDELLDSSNLSTEQYMKITRELSDDEKKETGFYANAVLTKHLDAINLLTHLLRKLSTDSTDIKTIYRNSTNQLDRIFPILKIYLGDFKDLDSENIESIAKDYKCKLSLEMNCLLFTFLYQNDLDSFMIAKKEFIKLYRYDAPYMQTEFENVMYNITNIIKQNIIQKSDIQNYINEIDNNLNSIQGYSIVREDIITTLSTAEYLFDKYIKSCDERPDFDYSFISILYFQVLEKLLNTLLYCPFKNTLPNKAYTYNETFGLFGNANCFRKLNKKFYVKDTIEMGGFVYLLEELISCKNNCKYKTFIYNEHNNIINQDLTHLKKEIFDISKRRNNAAHPVLINYNDAKQDKISIYSIDYKYKESVKIRDTLIELLKIFAS